MRSAYVTSNNKSFGNVHSIVYPAMMLFDGFDRTIPKLRLPVMARVCSDESGYWLVFWDMSLICLAVAFSGISYKENLEFGVLDIFMLHTAAPRHQLAQRRKIGNWWLMAMAMWYLGSDSSLLRYQDELHYCRPLANTRPEQHSRRRRHHHDDNKVP